MSYYFNAIGNRFPLPERPLEPDDDPVECPDDEEYDRAEDEMNGRFNRR